MSNEYKIAVLIPTRGRTEHLNKSIFSLVDRATDPDSLQFMLGFDRDDQIGLPYFQEHIQPKLDKQEVDYTILTFDRMGYVGLNRYYNELAKHTDSDWLFSWGDDSYMETNAWDDIITAHTGEFKLLKVHTHNEHPYSIFPIWPREWYDLFGHCSRHQMGDAELSQMAYMLDIMEIVDITVTHDRPDLSQRAPDATHKERILLEGNPVNPLDFHHVDFNTKRMEDCQVIANYMKTIGQDTTWWDNVKVGRQDPWVKLIANDPNAQMTSTRRARGLTP
jgi:hypothetical protein